MEQVVKSLEGPTAFQWKVGGKRVTVINDSYFQADYGYFTQASEQQLDSILQASFRPSPPILTTNVFLIESDDQTPILIDVGMGTIAGPGLTGNLLSILTAIGMPPEQIGTVLLTHLHGDHFYGLTDQEGKKNFPNSSVWVSEAETDYWFGVSQLNEGDQQNSMMAKTALENYRRLREFSETELLPGISTVPLPGHTPGQTGFLLQSEGEQLLFCADLLTIPAIQTRIPEVGFATDVDHDLAVKTRKSTLLMAAENRLLLAGAHFEYPCLSYVVAEEGGGFRLVPKQFLS